MHRRWTILTSLCAVLIIMGITPTSVSARVDDPLIIDPEVLYTGPIGEIPTDYAIIVQATSLRGQPHHYILTVTNTTPWSIPSLHVLDRYTPEYVTDEELSQEWFAGAVEPDESVSVCFTYTEGPLEGGCHQLEISIADGLSTILMDCSTPGSTTVWQVAITYDMANYMQQEALTLDEPTGVSKIGLHVTRNNSPAIMDFVTEAQPSVVVAVGDIGWLADVKAASPDTITLARLAESDQSYEGDPTERAREFVAQNAGIYLSHPAVDYWLGWNEPVISSQSDMAWYAQFESERVIAMAELGLKVAIGNFSVGVPEPATFGQFLTAVETAQSYDGIMALHEYSAPDMWSGVGAGVPGLTLGSDYGSLTLRYRIWYDNYLQPANLVIPLVITEAGIDGGVLTEDLSFGGWKDAMTDYQYLEQLSWYDDELRRDPYVLGMAVFNAGDDSGDWESFDVTDLLSDMVSIIRSK